MSKLNSEYSSEKCCGHALGDHATPLGDKMLTPIINIPDITRDMTIKVKIKGLREYRLRMRLAKRLIILASRVLGCHCVAEITIDRVPVTKC
jgi:hypothetical protein